jgi:heterodisulfide reductase subunit A
MVSEKTYPAERIDADEAPRIGVFVCHCGKNIGGVVDVPEVKKDAETLPDVSMVETNLYSCSQDTQALIRQSIIEHNLNRIVVAACTPRTHEPLFQDTLREAGLNRCLVEMVNIRDQCSWVHMHEKGAATEKAKDLVRMAVAKAKQVEPLPEAVIGVIPKGLIIGGGLAGMTAALSLARQGFECYLVERASDLGGNLRQTYFTLQGSNPQKHLDELIGEVTQHEKIHVFTEATIQEIEGFVGNFKTMLSCGNGRGAKTEEIDHGTIIIATGATAYEPDEYLYGKHDNVVLQQALEERLALGDLAPKDLKHVVMIQCVGSRDKTHTYCSAICCNQAIKNALKVKEINPDASVTILYRDVMSYGFSEDYYALARDRGISFIRYNPEQKPTVEDINGRLRVTVRDRLVGKNLIIDADLLALSSAMVPYENKALVEQLKVPLSADGFFLESHAQLKPVDSYVDGIYLCGMAQFPKPDDECIAHAKAAVAKAAILLAKGYVTAEPIVASCDMDQCIGCGICAHLCPYSAIRMTKVGKVKKADFVAAACKGCGVCSSYCPTRAIAMGRFTDDQIALQIKAFGSQSFNRQEQTNDK